MTSISSPTIIECSGAPRERGQQHGEAARREIERGLERWFASIERRHRVDPDDYVADFIASTSFIPALREWTPALLDELIGIAEGASRPFSHLLAYNMIDEEWEFSRNFAAPAPGCTAVGWRGDAGSPPILAQTMDLPTVHDSGQCLLRIAPDDGPTVQVLSWPGCLGLTGCNSAGIGVVVNNLSTLPAGGSGVPVVFLMRGVLERATLDDAADFITAAPHATGQHYGIGSPDGVRGFEGWFGGVAGVALAGEHLLHSNHPLAGGPERDNAETAYDRTSTRPRLDHVTRGAPDATDQRAIEQLLEDTTTPVSIAPCNGSMTFGAVSMILTAPPRMHIAYGPPHLAGWQNAPFPGQG